MSDMWVTIPAEDVRVMMPVSMADTNVKIMFRDVETIDSVIVQLESIKEILKESANLFA